MSLTIIVTLVNKCKSPNCSQSNVKGCGLFQMGYLATRALTAVSLVLPVGTMWREVAHFALLDALPAATGKPRRRANRRYGALCPRDKKNKDTYINIFHRVTAFSCKRPRGMISECRRTSYGVVITESYQGGLSLALREVIAEGINVCELPEKVEYISAVMED